MQEVFASGSFLGAKMFSRGSRKKSQRRGGNQKKNCLLKGATKADKETQPQKDLDFLEKYKRGEGWTN